MSSDRATSTSPTASTLFIRRQRHARETMMSGRSSDGVGPDPQETRSQAVLSEAPRQTLKSEGALRQVQAGWV